MIDTNILRYEERAILTLRSLYSKAGYRPFKIAKFEEYDLYSKNKDFLVSDSVITFNDTDGRLLALKPDVTLSIIKNCDIDSERLQKFYYNENVYRVSDGSHTYKEIMQTGLECIGNITEADCLEVTKLAIESLKALSENFVMLISNTELINGILNDYELDQTAKQKAVKAINEKNAGELKALLGEEKFAKLKCLVKSYPTSMDTLGSIEKIIVTDETKSVFDEFSTLCKELFALGYEQNIKIDFSVVSSDGYYSGIIFKGFINGISLRVLSGGRYDKLMLRMGKNAGALGFAVYLDTLERLGEKQENTDDGIINIALPKGRLGEKVYSMFENAGFDCPAIKETNRKLIFENKQKGLRFFWVKPSDVAIYVERGAADIGVAGKDILLEYCPDVYELLDLNIGKCRMAVAAKNDFCDDNSRTLKVATKFSNIAKNYYAGKCRDIDIIHLNGSIEIAPILGLSDVIVDIVETGKTLKENNLEPFETIVPISARLISNKASFGFKAGKIEQIKKGLLAEVQKND